MRFLVVPYEKLDARIPPPAKNTEVVSYPRRWRGQTGVDIGLPKVMPDAIKFNPSISLLEIKDKSCIYAMVYRALVPAGRGFGKRENRPRTKKLRNGRHIKVGIWDRGFANHWDGIGMAKIEVFDTGVVRVIWDYLDIKGGGLMDPRIIKHSNKHYIQYSDYMWEQKIWDVKTPTNLKKCGTNWDSLCILIGMVEIKIDTEMKGYEYVGRGRILCQDQSRGVEKNWAYVPRRPLTMQYSMQPMQYLQSRASSPSEMTSCKTVKPVGNKNDTFVRLKAHLGNALGPHHGIACTSPLQHFDSTSFIGLGHIKVQFKNYKAKLSETSNVHRFIKAVGTQQGVVNKSPKTWFNHGIDLHHDFIYVMFLYTVDKKTLQLKKFSNGFLPQSKSLGYFVTLVFPMAIEPFAVGKEKGSHRSPNAFAMSVGLSDHDCGIWVASKQEIRALLVHDPDMPPEKFDFEIPNFP